MKYPLIVAGKEVHTSECFEVFNPFDNSVVGKVSSATAEEIEIKGGKNHASAY